MQPSPPPRRQRVKEPCYGITRKLGHRVYQSARPKPEYYYILRRGRRKVCEVWSEGEVRQLYDKRGKITTNPTVGKDLGFINGHYMLVFLMLRDAFDVTTAGEWSERILDKLLLPANPARWDSTLSNCVSYKKTELFVLILDARQLKVAR